jgi:UDP-glucose 4-epimerase
VPTGEDHPIDPQYPYALSKYQGEQAAFHWHRVYGLPVNSVRAGLKNLNETISGVSA